MFKIKDDCKNTIVYFDRQLVSKKEASSLKSFLLENCKSKRVAIDLGNIKIAHNCFFEVLKEFAEHKKLSLFNIPPDVNLLLYLMNYNPYIKLYVNEMDFIDQKRELIYRNFRFC